MPSPVPSPTKLTQTTVPLQIVAAMAEEEAAPEPRPCAWCYAAIGPDEEAIEIDCSVCDNYFVHRERVLSFMCCISSFARPEHRVAAHDAWLLRLPCLLQQVFVRLFDQS